jgi:hypothetical protein
LHDVKKGFMGGYVSKEDYAAALRGHQAAVDATKSQQRDAAYAYQRSMNEEKVGNCIRTSHSSVS